MKTQCWFRDDDFICNPTNIDPREYLPVTGENQQYIIENIGESTMLIAGSVLQINNTPYNLYVIKDISLRPTPVSSRCPINFH